jgi:hypothetical protein
MKICFIVNKIDPRIASYRLRAEAVKMSLAARFEQFSVLDRLPKPQRFDKLILSKRYDEEALDYALNMRSLFGTKIILDLCDNHFMVSGASYGSIKSSRKSLLRAVKICDWVVSSSSYLATVIHDECGKDVKVDIIDDFVEIEAPPVLPHYVLSSLRLNFLRRWLRRNANEKTKLVWFGNSAGLHQESGIAELSKSIDVLNKVGRESATLTIISNSRSMFNDISDRIELPSYYLPWHRATIFAALRLHDAAIMPISQNAFNWAKSSNRLTTSIHSGLQVVASELPSYLAYTDHAFIGDFEKGLTELIAGKRKNVASFDVELHNREISAGWYSILSRV